MKYEIVDGKQEKWRKKEGRKDKIEKQGKEEDEKE